MIRKLVSLSVALPLGLVVLPALPAYAATGTATLVAGAEVFPGQDRAFTVDVVNADSALIGGQTINNVEIILPTGAGLRTDVLTKAPTGWTLVTVARANGQQGYQFRGPATGGIAPGARLSFPMVNDVVAPSTADKSGAFQVLVSGDRGQTQADAVGALTTAVKVLEVVDGSLKALGSSDGNTANDGLVADGSATSGQTITYGLEVRNYATSALTVAPTLTSNGGDTITQGGSKSVPGNGGTAVYTATVALAAGQTADRSATFTAKAATATATARDKTAAYTVEAPALVTLTASSFSPSNVRTPKNAGDEPFAYGFSISGQKQRTPGLTGLTGSLSFLSNTAALASATESPAQSNTSSIGTGTKSVTFAYQSTPVRGPDGRQDVSFSFAATDTNGFPFSQTLTLDDVVNLDSIAPELDLQVTLPTDADGARQIAAKNGDTLSIAGRVVDCAAATNLKVSLVPNVGAEIPVTVTRSVDGCTYSGSARPTFDAAATSFRGVASVQDLAGNTGGFQTATPTVVDNVLATLSAAQTLDASLYPSQNPPTGPTTKVQVDILEANGPVRGGCNPTLWSLAGEQLGGVYRVLYSDGTPCQTGLAGPDDTRILVLTSKKDVDYEGKVTYTKGTRPGQDPIKDDAAGESLTATIDIVTGVSPLAPVLSKGFRNNGANATPETATFDDGTYWTRFTGTDFVMEFTGGRSGYVVQVLDQNGALLRTSPATTATARVVVPVDATQATYQRFLRLVNGRGLVSTLVPFKVTVDQAAPALAGSTLNATRNSVTATFNEKLWEGTNFAQDWKVWTKNPNFEPGDDPGSARLYYGTSSVAGTQSTTRTLSLARALPAGEEYGNAEYFLLSDGGVRYLDRAGNPLADI